MAIAAQAMRRIEAFERRVGVAVDRVMVPPHEECSEEMLKGLRRCGFEAVTMTRPYPWLAAPPRPWLARPAGAGRLVGWKPVDVVDAMPVLLRHPLLTRDGPEIVLRAFLDHPLVLYGHHDDLREGLGLLQSAAAEVNRLGDVSWLSLGDIAASNYETRRDGDLLRVKPLGRRLRVRVPEDAGSVLVEAQLDDPATAALQVAGKSVPFGEPFTADPGSTVEVSLVDPSAVDVAAVRSPRPNPAVLARRLAGEGRDRLLPVLARR
jgi:hypothetical protein